MADDITIGPPVDPTRTARPFPTTTLTLPPPTSTWVPAPSTTSSPQTTSPTSTSPPSPSSNKPTPSPSTSSPNPWPQPPSTSSSPDAPSPSRSNAESKPIPSTSVPTTVSSTGPYLSSRVPDVVAAETVPTPDVVVGDSRADHTPASTATSALSSDDTTSSLGSSLIVIVGVCVVGSVAVFLALRRRRQTNKNRMTIVSPPVTRGRHNGPTDWCDRSPHHHISFVDAILTKRGPPVSLYSPGSTRGFDSLEQLSKVAPPSYVTSVGATGLAVTTTYGKAVKDPPSNHERVALEPPRRLNMAVAATVPSSAPSHVVEDVITLGLPRRERIEVQQVMASPASSSQTTFSL
ncbi:hypothetical protein H310_10767 [Aphanomyces invadans]|uniref:Uncharacterized protein n=1 Tax=Aphanomyces invadans TaxID=157072 RepID=A0A024TQ46_9STRA|nr:hypothetical protein H310_10767 [Aphanomyces invadans]ETV96134.1 hypothetical protein H310_10767 [Aphanomyces invadans]|eukprot:XP_008875445.1 hypothetical protein H310_10767 [Aphanomyces invadans]